MNVSPSERNATSHVTVRSLGDCRRMQRVRADRECTGASRQSLRATPSPAVTRC